MDLATVRDLAAATPATRNRVVDLLRAAAIVVVVLGHWLMAAVVVRGGELVPGHLLGLATWTHPLTWVFQVMPVFFLVGGYANALLVALGPRPRDAVCRRGCAPACGASSSRSSRCSSPGSSPPRWPRGGRARPGRCARHPRWRSCRRGSSRPTSSCARRAGDAVAVGARRVVVGGRRAGARVPRRPREHRDRHPGGRLRQLRRRVGDGAPARLRLARRAAGRDRAGGCCSRRSGRIGVVALVWAGPYPVSMVGPGRRGREQLVPDAG